MRYPFHFLLSFKELFALVNVVNCEDRFFLVNLRESRITLDHPGSVSVGGISRED